jgi:hypothetical protein
MESLSVPKDKMKKTARIVLSAYALVCSDVKTHTSVFMCHSCVMVKLIVLSEVKMRKCVAPVLIDVCVSVYLMIVQNHS